MKQIKTYGHWRQSFEWEEDQRRLLIHIRYFEFFSIEIYKVYIYKKKKSKRADSIKIRKVKVVPWNSVGEEPNYTWLELVLKHSSLSMVPSDEGSSYHFQLHTIKWVAKKKQKQTENEK